MGKNNHFLEYGFDLSNNKISDFLDEYSEEIEKQNSIGNLLTVEARFTKNIYKMACSLTNAQDFTRNHKDPNDPQNIFLNHGNYLAYGYGALAC
ncbi:MAG: CRISPR-associated endonuclease Cas1 [Psittacicella sp.]